MAASIKNVLIGLFVIAAVVVIAYVLLFLHPKVGDNAKVLRVRFTDIDKVNIGTRVTFAGKPVGEVVSIKELPEARTERKTDHGQIYVYELVLKVDSGVDVFNSDIISLRTSGLLGERNIEINPDPLQPGQTLKNVENEVLYAVDTTSVEDTMKDIEELSKKFGIVLDDVHNLMEEIKNQEIVAKVNKSVENILAITGSLNDPEKWRTTLDNIVSLSTRVNDSWTTVDHSINNIYSITERAKENWSPSIEQSLQNIHELSARAKYSWDTVDLAINNMHVTTQNVISFSEKVNQVIDYTLQGEGSVGQLLVGDDLYLRLKSILHKGEVVMNDVNTYGLLFHLNKRWQRLQARRVQMLDRLSNPNAFSQFFNQEVDEISASLSRVSMVLTESECYPESLLFNPDFTQRFAELLKRIENMEENLKMYNEQVIDQELSSCTYMDK